jgi:hypothetical protein
MQPLGMTWGLIGLFAAFWKVVLVTGVAATVLWRTGLWQHPAMRLLLPWTPASRLARTRPAPAEQRARSIWNDRFFWFVTILASVAVAAWVVTRVMVSAGVHSH